MVKNHRLHVYFCIYDVLCLYQGTTQNHDIILRQNTSYCRVQNSMQCTVCLIRMNERKKMKIVHSNEWGLNTQPSFTVRCRSTTPQKV